MGNVKYGCSFFLYISLYEWNSIGMYLNRAPNTIENLDFMISIIIFLLSLTSNFIFHSISCIRVFVLCFDFISNLIDEFNLYCVCYQMGTRPIHFNCCTKKAFNLNIFYLLGHRPTDDQIMKKKPNGEKIANHKMRKCVVHPDTRLTIHSI